MGSDAPAARRVAEAAEQAVLVTITVIAFVLGLFVLIVAYPTKLIMRS
ncbi:hypothetical protein [Gordonia aurantiaca]